MEKTYVLDTSVLLQTPYALEAFEDNQIVLPIAVLEELDALKGAEGEQGTNARQAIRRLEALRAQGNLLSGVPLPNGGWLRVETRLNLYQETMGSKILALFLGLYLGLTFLLAAAAVLALQQLSQAADNAGRYAILRRLGAEEKLVSRSAVEQVALAFLLPLGLALVHTVVGMKAANDLIAQAAKVDSVQSALVTALVLLLVYGGYFLATSLACRRLALDR